MAGPDFFTARAEALGAAGQSAADARKAVAAHYGFPTWDALATHVAQSPAHPTALYEPFVAEIAYYGDRADGLREALRDRVPEARMQVSRSHPAWRGRPAPRHDLDAEDARLITAREHGCADWPALERLVADVAAHPAAHPFAAAFAALKAGDDAAFAALLRAQPALAKTLGTNATTLLNLSVAMGRRKPTDALLAAGANPNTCNVREHSPIHQAGYKGDAEAVRTLLRAGANPAGTARLRGRTPLMHALFWGHTEAAMLLGDAPGTPAAFAGRNDVRNLRAALAAIERAHMPRRATRRFYRPHIGFPFWQPTNDLAENRNEALTYAARNSATDAMKFLVDAGADVNADPYRGTPLVWAAHANNPASVRWLLDHGAEINRRSGFGGPGHGNGVTALHIAAQCGYEGVVDLLLAEGADPTIRDEMHNGAAAGWARNGGHEALAARLQVA